MKVVGYILLVLSIIGAVILFVCGLVTAQILLVLSAVVSGVFAFYTSLSIVYAADIPDIAGSSNYAVTICDSNTKEIKKSNDEIKLLKTEIKLLKIKIEELEKNIVKENN